MGVLGSMVSPSAIKQIRKKYNLSENDSISSEQFREAMGISQNKGNKTKGSMTFSYIYDVEFLENGYKITLTGRHYSTNNINSFSRTEAIRYKNAIKKAAKDWLLKNRAIHKKIVPMEKARVEYYFHNPNSRDTDNNSIKAFQDTFSVPKLKGSGVLGLIVDDNRKCLQRHKPQDDEVINNTYKVVAYLTRVE
ncbi:MAG: hypothetical protein IE916_00465 [Epsilonproteobacteria bacterium]|nr:hypothetical protein [Campylobacterota bacterium]